MIEELIKKYKLNFKINTQLLNNLNNLNFRNIKNKYHKKVIKINDGYLTKYNINRRIINIYTEEKLNTDYYINKIDKICNFYDSIFHKENKKKLFLMDLYFKDKNPKLLTEKHPEACKENINSASNLIKKNYIVIYRHEEWSKILIHELIHYFNLHIYKFQKDLLYAFKDINTQSKISPNEGYTEFLSLIFYYFIFHKEEINKRLTCELSWGFIQTAKVLKSKNINKYEELFTKEYKQNSSVLSYYLLKTYFLYNKRFQKTIILYYRDENENNYFQDINLKDKKFSTIINYCLKNLNENDKSLKMSLVK